MNSNRTLPHFYVRFFIGVNMTKQEIIKRFESFGFKLGLDQGLVFGFIKMNTTSVCSMIGENITISLSSNLKQDKDRAVKLMTQLFPTATYIEQNELLHACYFSIQRIN